MEHTETKGRTMLQEAVPFSESVIWDLQRRYFEEMGAEAWRQGEVPHYVTTNPRQANAYAEMIVALYHDYGKKVGMDTAANEPIRIVELGAGSGRLGYYLLRQLDVLCAQEDIPREAFHCILTDFTQSNLDFWRRHPRFDSYFQAGLLDIALVDAVNPDALALQVSETIMDPQQGGAPMVLIANYLFDSIPQELLHIDEGNCARVFAAATLPQGFVGGTTAQFLGNLELEYAIDPSEDPLWMEMPYAPLIDAYREEVAKAYLLFPVAAIRCLSFFKSLSSSGLLLLTADKGGHTLGSVLLPSPPSLTAHGSISVNVNYHALQAYCALTGGISFFPEYQYSSVNTGFMLLMQDASTYTSTLAAGRKWLDDTGPDTFFTMYKCIRSHIDILQMRDILAALRLGLYDSHQLGIYIYRIASLLPQAMRHEVADLINVMHRCWENYFALGENNDLATTLGSICYELDAYDWALFYFRQSTDIYGPYSGTFYNMAVCYHLLGQADHAILLLEKVVLYDPGNENARQLLAECLGEAVATYEGEMR